MKKIIVCSLTTMSLLALTLSAQEVHITIPKIPEVPTVVVEKEKDVTGEVKKAAPVALQKQEVSFSHKVAPHLQKKAKTTKKATAVGDVVNGRVAAYLEMPAMDKAALKKAIHDAGFNIKAIMKVDEKGDVLSYVITNPTLIKLASKPNRGFGATLRITLDKKDNLISITNPKYILKAFLQDDYDPKAADELLASLRDGFKELQNSSEMIKFSAVSNFVFMKGMPGYGNMETLAKAENARLLNKARASKRIIFEQKLQNGATLIGVSLSKETSKFIQKTGFSHAALLPYPVLIENGEAKTLDPKYYIAVMYPKLKMSQFMQIAAIPDVIDKELDLLFR